MAINRADCEKANNCKIPTDQPYRLRVIKTEFTPKNNSGNPMTTLNVEIIEPQSINDENGNEQNIAGRSFRMFLVHSTRISGNAKTSPQEQVFQLMEKLKITDLMERDENNDLIYEEKDHAKYFLGLEFDCMLSCKENLKRAKANRELGERVGPILKDGEGNPIQDGWQISAFPSDVLDLCNPERNDVVANAAY